MRPLTLEIVVARAVECGYRATVKGLYGNYLFDESIFRELLSTYLKSYFPKRGKKKGVMLYDRLGDK